MLCTALLTDKTVTALALSYAFRFGRGLRFCALIFQQQGCWQDSDHRHHPIVFMLENMAMINKIPDSQAAKIHAHFDAWIRPRATPIGNFYQIKKLLLIGSDLCTVFF